VNVLNKELQTGDKTRFSSLQAGQWPTSSHHKKLIYKQNVMQRTTCEMGSIMTVSISDEIEGGVDGGCAV